MGLPQSLAVPFRRRHRPAVGRQRRSEQVGGDRSRPRRRQLRLARVGRRALRHRFDLRRRPRVREPGRRLQSGRLRFRDHGSGVPRVRVPRARRHPALHGLLQPGSAGGLLRREDQRARGGRDRSRVRRSVRRARHRRGRRGLRGRLLRRRRRVRARARDRREEGSVPGASLRNGLRRSDGPDGSGGRAHPVRAERPVLVGRCGQAPLVRAPRRDDRRDRRRTATSSSRSGR